MRSPSFINCDRIEERLGALIYETSIYVVCDGKFIKEIQISADVKQRLFGVRVFDHQFFGAQEMLEHVSSLSAAFRRCRERIPICDVLFDTFNLKITDEQAHWSLCDHTELCQLTRDAWYEIYGQAPPVEPISFDPAGPIELERKSTSSRLANEQSYFRAQLEPLLIAGKVSEWNQIPLGFFNRTNFDRADLSNKLLKDALLKCRFNNSNFSNADLTGASFSGAEINDCSFKNAVMTGAYLQFAHARSSSFEDARMDNVMANGVVLIRATLKGATLINADLSHAELTLTDFSGCKVQNADFSHSNVHDANFCGANLSKAKFKGATVTGTDFAQSNLKDANFDGAWFNGRTKFPATFDVVETKKMKWSGDEPSPYKAFLQDAILNISCPTFDEMLAELPKYLEPKKLKNVLKMLSTDKFELFSELNAGDQALSGIVRSQTDPDLIYACSIGKNSVLSCMTQNLRRCGGLRDGACKHFHVMLLGLCKAGCVEPTSALRFAIAGNIEEPVPNKKLTTELFIKFKGSQAGEIDWRPTETVPEDFYSF